MKKICVYCKKPFETKSHKTQFCSRKCIGANKREKNKKPDKICLICGNVFTPHRRNVCSRKCAMIQKWQESNFRKKQLSNLQDPNRWNESLRNQVSEKMKEVSARTEWKENMSEKQLRYWSDDNNKIARSKCLNFGGRYRWKEYTLPSGKIVKVQGYEDRALDKLLEIYSEDDLLISISDIRKETGSFFYVYENRKRLYIPDIYIKSSKTIIEVKSKWTYEQNKVINELKKRSVESAGFNFMYLVFD